MESEKILTGSRRMVRRLSGKDKNNFEAKSHDYAGQGINLNEQLIRNKAATFYFRMNSDAMIEAGIFDRDILVVDRSIGSANGKVVIASVNGELIVRRLEKTINQIRLLPENRRMAPLELPQDSDF